MELDNFKSTAHNDCDVFLTEKQLADRWQISVKKLQADRWNGVGAPYIKLQRLVRYRLSDIRAYETARFQMARHV